MCDNCIQALENLANGQEPEVPTSFIAEQLSIEETADGSMVRLTMSKEAFLALTVALAGPQGAFRLLGRNPDEDA